VRLSEKQAEDVWSILATACGAESKSSGHGWESFRRYVTDDHPWHEFRFCGSLGSGGKLYVNHGRIFVACYPEDRTPERERRIKLANARLEALASREEGLEAPEDVANGA
jgi:hypothetical protein